jgi:hypothetical protein
MPQPARKTIQKRWLALTLLVLALIGFGVYATRDTRNPGIWTKNSPDTLEFDGEIWAGTEIAFLEIVTPEIKRIVVRSGGGDSFVALTVANYIFDHRLDLEVRDHCHSSCANYWFTAAHNKIVQKGAAVGFHGDPYSSLQVQRRTGEHITESDLREVESFHVLAQTFYKRIGLNPAIFAYSIKFTQTNNVNLWNPNPQELGCAGVKNLKMWSPQTEAEHTLGDFAEPNTISTSAKDIRKPKPDFCQQIKSGS